MFKKLLSNLPFNPSLIGQVSFYAKRMHDESALRRMGFVMLLLAMFVQIFSVVSPPEPTLASSGNDIIQGGFANRDQAVLHCLNSQRDFNKILAYFKISCTDVANAETVTLPVNAYGRKMHSMGRWAQGPTIARTGKPTGEYEVAIPGAHSRLFMRNLWAWYSNEGSTERFLRMRNAQGVIVMVMFDCGNIVTVDRYAPPPPPPAPTPTPPPTNRRQSASFTANCTAVAWTASDPDGKPRIRVYVAPRSANPETDWNNKGPFRHSADGSGTGNINTGSWPVPAEFRTATNRYRVFVVVSDRLPGGTMDDVNFLRATPTTGIEFGPCVSTPPPPPEAPEPPAEPNLELSKKARNVTKNTADANSTQASPGDTIQYTLTVKNTGNGKAEDFAIEENLADVLEYADVVDLNGATMGDDKIARWPKSDVPARGSISRSVTVKVKAVIPATPVSASHQGSFDLTMTNVYGNAVNIGVPGPPVKQVEQVVTTLPNTGPGESMAAVLTLVVVVGYFFARSRLLAKEYDIVRTDFGSYGGAV